MGRARSQGPGDLQVCRMVTVCLLFHVHQPFRLRTIGLTEIGQIRDPFGNDLNDSIVRRAARECYIPVNTALTRLCREYKGDIRLSLSITGTAIEQLEQYAPESLDSFRALAETGEIELLGETYYHSLSSLFDLEEFRQQVSLHTQLIERVFRLNPTTFRNTELIYEDRLADMLIPFSAFTGLVTEGTRATHEKHPRSGIGLSNTGRLVLFLRNYRLSDDIAFRFSQSCGSSLTAREFLKRLKNSVDTTDQVVVIYVDYETFGEHQRRESGIIDFLIKLLKGIAESADMDLGLPAAVSTARHRSLPRISFPGPVSWADSEKDLSAWLGNPLQENAAHTLYNILREARQKGDSSVLRFARLLSSSDHLMYLSTKDNANGEVHRYFSPYNNTEEAYRNLLFAMADLEEKLK